MEKLECPICLTEINNLATVTTGCCNKQFHTECYTKCMNEKMVCPLCRAKHGEIIERRIVISGENTCDNFFTHFGKFMGTILSVSIGLYIIGSIINKS